MIKSMTGYGKTVTKYNNKTITVEIKTLNSKQADVILKSPSCYKNQELCFRKQISLLLERGKIDCSINVEDEGSVSPLNINSERFISYYKQLNSLANKVQADKTDILRFVLQLPDIVSDTTIEADEAEIQTVKDLLAQAIAKTDEYRIAEGKSLERDLQLRIGLIEEKLREIDYFESTRIKQIKERLNAKLKELNLDNIDKNRFEQELIYYLEKMDITEEKIRLRQHLNYFVKTMNGKISQGKKLGFIVQEIGREINTLGSKSGEANMQKKVVEMKDELEKIKEQVLNVL